MKKLIYLSLLSSSAVFVAQAVRPDEQFLKANFDQIVRYAEGLSDKLDAGTPAIHAYWDSIPQQYRAYAGSIGFGNGPSAAHYASARFGVRLQPPTLDTEIFVSKSLLDGKYNAFRIGHQGQQVSLEEEQSVRPNAQFFKAHFNEIIRYAEGLSDFLDAGAPAIHAYWNSIPQQYRAYAGSIGFG